ncbi:MAG TPA: MFS transporter [Candidatus Binataceae bacterium]|nr:MFS transporter [Candidatus Binataceae bacterium]
MTTQRRGQMIVATLFLSMLFIIGGTFGTAGVFFTPLLKYLGVSRAKLSVIPVLASAGGVIFSPIVGWLLDRIEARWLVGAGAGLAALALLMASQAHSYQTLVYSSLLLSLGMTAATTVPGGTVLANWFRQRRGLAMGITWTGMPVGAALMLQLSSYVIRHESWRWAYAVLALPMLLVVMPMGLIFVRSRPPELAPDEGAYRQAAQLPGLQVSQALGGRSFWLLGWMCFAYAFSAGAVTIHVPPYLIELGTTPARAAGVLSAMFAVDALCKPFFGALADLIGPRRTLTMVYSMMSLGCLSLVYAAGAWSMVLFVVVYGIGVGAPVALTPMLGAEVFGLKRFGTLWGLVGTFTMLAQAVGPIGAGRIFDLYASYRPAFAICFVLLALAALAPLACVSLLPTPAATPQPAVVG